MELIGVRGFVERSIAPVNDFDVWRRFEMKEHMFS